MKPVLVIGCSDAKLTGEHKAIDLYQGAMYKLLKARLPNPLEHFTILIMSAKHGLISADSSIDHYDVRMPSKVDTNAVEGFCSEHGAKARKQLKALADAQTELFVVLSNDYLKAFDGMFDGSGQRIISRFKSSYISRKHKGIGELRGRLARIIEQRSGHAGDRSIQPLHFRSGVANVTELGFVSAGCSVGGSLAHTNTNKMTHLLSELLNTTKHRPLFLDNGLITLLGKNKCIDTNWVFEQYKSIANTLPRKQAKNLYIVVPDDVNDNAAAIAILKRHKADIFDLIRSGVEVIIPIHRSKDIEALALSMLKEVNYSTKVRIGIPCLKKKDLDLALSVEDIERLLSIKHPKDPKRKLITKLHFFGLSEASGKVKRESRLLVASLYGLTDSDVSMDCCRTTAVFGKSGATNLRVGSQLEQDIATEHVKAQVVASHSFADEFYAPEGEPFATAKFYEMINEFEIFDFICLYNEVMADNPMLRIDHEFVQGDEVEAMELAWQLTSVKAVDVYIYDKLKDMNWRSFTHMCKNLKELPPNEVRFEAIKRLFKTGSDHEPVQMPLALTA